MFFSLYPLSQPEYLQEWAVDVWGDSKDTLCMSLEELQARLEEDAVIQSRTVDITIEDDMLKVREHGNPAMKFDELEGQPVETGEPHLTSRVQELADAVLGVEAYPSPRTYEDEGCSEIDIRRP